VSAAVQIDRIAAGGEGVGTLPDGRRVFVPRTAPGDLVQLTALRPAARYARGRVARVLQPGPDRVAPRCRHYDGDQCGGCQLQHLTENAQQAARRSIVGDALRRIGHLDAPDPPLEPSPAQWGYRAKISLARDAAGGRIGFHRLGRPTAVFRLERCEIAAAPLAELWDAVRQDGKLLPPDLEHLTLRLDRAGGRHLLARVREPRAWTGAGRLAERLVARGTPATLWWEPARGAARAVAGSDSLFPATVFEQVHPAMGDAVRRFAVTQLGPVGGAHVWDLYAGIGETTDLLRAQGASVESVELNRRAVVEAVRRTGEEDTAVTRHVGKVEDWLNRLRSPDLVIANPPRAGMAPQVIAAIASAAAQRVVYVSCDAATLARDLARLLSAPAVLPSYRLSALRCFDLFPQTAHVETVAVLDRV